MNYIFIDSVNNKISTIEGVPNLETLYKHICPDSDHKSVQWFPIDDKGNGMYCMEDAAYSNPKSGFTYKGWSDIILGNAVVVGPADEEGESTAPTITVEELEAKIFCFSNKHSFFAKKADFLGVSRPKTAGEELCGLFTTFNNAGYTSPIRVEMKFAQPVLLPCSGKRKHNTKVTLWLVVATHGVLCYSNRAFPKTVWRFKGTGFLGQKIDNLKHLVSFRIIGDTQRIIDRLEEKEHSNEAEYAVCELQKYM